METLVVVAQHRSRSYTRSRSKIHDRFSSSHSRGFGAITCWSFEIAGRGGVGILPSPPPATITIPSLSTRDPPEKGVLSSPIPITPNPSPRTDNFSGSELWAGPAYSNSPPPSSLPTPKFSLCKKRSVSLDLPASLSAGFVLHPVVVVKSAPTSPKRDRSSPTGGFSVSNARATENLCRILNLDIAGDD